MHSRVDNPRLQQLQRGVESFRKARLDFRPERGWIRAVREARGVSTGELGRILGVSRQLPLQFEKAETDDSITLKSLRKVADALDCDLVYALVPRAGTERGRSERTARLPAIASSQKRNLGHPTSAVDDESVNLYFCD